MPPKRKPLGGRTQAQMIPDYLRIEEQLVEWLPELRPAAEAYWRREGAPGNDSGPDVLFEELLRPYITILLAAPASQQRASLLQRAFDVTEALVSAGGDLHDLAAIAVLEGQTSRWFHFADPFLGPLSRAEADQHGWAVRDDSPLDHPIDLYGVGRLVEELLADGNQV